MNNIKYLLLSLFLINISIAFAQDDDNYDPADFMSNQISSSGINSTGVSKSETFSKWNYNINLGTSFSTGTLGSVLEIYTAPQINYNISSKWQFSTGFLIINSKPLTDDIQTAAITQTYIMNRINYKANEKLRISGEILYGMNPTSYNNSGIKKAEYLINFDAHYKINDNFSIGVRVLNTNMNKPYRYNNPLYPSFSPINPLYFSPFY